jgi:hypothetical protein
MARLFYIRELLLAAAMTAGLSISGAQATPILEISPSGILTGAKYVDVYGAGLYDVTFKAGTCAEVYGVCDVSHLTFTNETDALNASLALDWQVFANGPLGQFDSNPALTAGCTSPLATLVCGIITPYGFEFGAPPWLQGWSFENGVDWYIPPDREWHINGPAFTVGKVYEDHWIFAVWTKSTPIPEPGALSLFGAGLLLLFGIASRTTRRRGFS